MSRKVSVIIPTYNNAAYLRETIDSVLNQSFTDYEILVVDDGSTDQTAEVLKPFLNRIHYIKKTNGGPASARNLGVKESIGEYLAFLDADDRWAKEKLDQQVTLLNADPSVGLVYTSVEIIDENSQRLPQRDKTTPSVYSFLELFEHNVMATSSVMARRRCFDEFGLFDEDRDIISVEDYDMWLRISSKYKLAHIDHPLLQYRLHSQGISRNIGRSYRAEAKVIRKNVALFGQTYPSIRASLGQRLLKIYLECWHDHFYTFVKRLKKILGK